MKVQISEHETVKDEEQYKMIPCEKCNFTFECKLAFEKHLHGIQHNIPLRDNLEFTDSDEEDEHDFREKCCWCNKIFTNFDSLDNHQSN